MKNKKWIKPRHSAFKFLFNGFIWLYARLKYGIRVKRMPRKEVRQSLILYNHQTGFDQFFIGFAIPKVIYFLATEDIFSLGFVSSIIRFLVAPIPIKKQTTDIKAVMNCIRVAKEGGSVAIAPEGNRTYSGETAYINPSIADLAKKMHLPIVFVKIEGGYGVQPRWADKIRKGKMSVGVSRIMEVEEYENLSKEELTEVIRKELYVNEGCISGEYKHKAKAEYLERAMYYCPDCGFSVFESEKDIIKCKKCGKQVKYTDTKELLGINTEFPYRFVTEWYAAQSDFVIKTDFSALTDEPIYKESVLVYNVTAGKKKDIIKKDSEIEVFGNKITLILAENEKTEMYFTDTKAVSVLSKNKLNIYFGDKIYQIRGGKRFNALKYVNIYYSAKNNLKESDNGNFIGI